MIKSDLFNFIFGFFLFSIMTSMVYAQQGNVFHVNQGIGDDNFHGSISAPYKTIQRCAQEAGAGDTCIVHQGVYRETVKPRKIGRDNAPISFASADGETVRVTGLDKISGAWELHKGSVYKTAVSSEVKQLFVADDLMKIARHPNSNTPFKPTFLTISERECQVYGSGKWTENESECRAYDDDGLCDESNSCWDKGFPRKKIRISSVENALNGEWTGATLAVLDKAGYNLERAIVLPDKEDQKISYEWFSEKKMAAGIKFYLVNALAALDADQEWFYDQSKQILYFKPMNESDLDNVFIKVRDLAFDLRNKSYIVVEGFEIFAASIKTGPKSKGVVLNRLKVEYPVNHQMFGATPNFPGQGANRHKINQLTLGKGITLGGSGNVLKNSSVAHSWCDGVTVYGESNSVINNAVFDVNWGMTACGAVSTNGSNHKVMHNSLYDCGRTCLWHQMTFDAEFAYNDIYNACWLGRDCGVSGSYAWYGAKADYSSDGDGNGVGTIYHHNWIHDNKSAEGGPCLYLDNDEQDYLVHHNVLWNCRMAFTLNDTYIPHGETGHRVFNNTCFNVDFRITDFGGSAEWLFSGVEFINNLCSSSRDEHYNKYNLADIVMSNNVGPGQPDTYAKNRYEKWSIDTMRLQNPLKNNFMPKALSPAVDKGKFINGITDNAVGVPDVGAYEFGYSDDEIVGFSLESFTRGDINQ